VSFLNEEGKNCTPLGKKRNINLPGQVKRSDAIHLNIREKFGGQEKGGMEQKVPTRKGIGRAPAG